MKTYQDLKRVGESDVARGAFCRAAINDFKSSKLYKDAIDGEAYYNKHNTTIEQFKKFLYTLSGNKVEDIFSANYKLKTLFFRRLVIQQVMYVLGNGVTLSNNKNKDKLGKDFDFKLQLAAKRAMAEGRAFGYWNNDHLEVFSYADTPSEPGFCPLYNEETGILDAGIRFWFTMAGDKEIFRATLYEADGYTEYKQTGTEEVELLQAKRGYIQNTRTSAAGGVEDISFENYTSLPIVPLYANDSRESELIGIRESIDCYDYIKSGLANDIDDTSGFYWIIKNTGGMDDVDLAQFIQRLKTVKATTLDGDQGVEAEAHTLDVPYQARQTMLELLRKDIYEDFQALDVNTLSAAQKTTQEIQAAYQSQDNKCADFEYFVIDFIQQILELAGIDDNPTFVWNKVSNQAEQSNMVLMAAQYLTPEAVVKHLPFLTPEEADEIIQQMDDQDMGAFNADDEMEEEGGDDADDENSAALDSLMDEYGNEVIKMLEELLEEI